MKKYEKVCSICGKTFWTNYPHAHCCSDDCRRQSQNACNRRCRRKALDRLKEEKKIPCVICGKMFHPHAGKQKTCSPECAEAMNNRKKHEWYRKHHKSKEYSERTCGVCGKLFQPHSGHEKYCSEACRKIKANTYYTPKGLERTCMVCGKKFIKTANAQKLCSPECARERRTQLMRENAEAQRMRAVTRPKPKLAALPDPVFHEPKPVPTGPIKAGLKVNPARLPEPYIPYKRPQTEEESKGKRREPRFRFWEDTYRTSQAGRYTEDEEETIKAMCRMGMHTDVIASVLGRDPKALEQKIYKMRKNGQLEVEDAAL